MMLQTVSEAFKELANPNDKVKMEAYLKNKFRCYGVKSPVRKEVLKEYYKEYGIPNKPIQVAVSLFNQPQRELHYAGQELLMKANKQWDRDFIKNIEWFITTNSWWDSVDYLASNVVGTYFSKWPEDTRSIIMNWNRSENLWLIRSSIIFQLKYKDKVNKDLLSDCIKSHVKQKDFFIRKAIGWALRQYGQYNPDWVIDFVNQNDLQSLSRKEALRKIEL